MSDYASAVANQFGLNSTFVQQMRAMPNISDENILKAGVVASSYGDFVDGRATSNNTTSPTTTTDTSFHGAWGIDERGPGDETAFSSFVSKFGADVVAVVVGLILVAVSVAKLA